MYIFFVVIFIIFSLNTQAEQLKVDVTAAGAILINADTGTVLFEKEPHLRLYPASTTKIATLLYALERKSEGLDDRVVASANSLKIVQASHRQAADSTHPSYRLEPEGTHMSLRVGEELSFRTLLYGLMLRSGNDAANVIAEYLSGNIPQFVQELNLFVASLGLAETKFSNPHGLFHLGHYTTAHDMAKLTQIALKNPMFREIVKTVHYPRHKTNKQEESVMTQGNRILKPGRNYYAKAIGVKTGYTFRSGNTFVAAAVHEGRTLIAVLFQAPKADNNFQDAIKLFELAFSQSKVERTLFAKGYDRFSLPIHGSKDPLFAILQEDLSVEYYPAEEPICNIQVHWNNALALPITKGDCVGELHLVTDDNKLLRSVPLFAVNTLEKSLSVRTFEFLSSPLLKGLYLFLIIIIALLLMLFRKRKYAR